ncbi:MAG: PAS domain S-box protein [Prochlorotrichaceae cyanobacterium]
MEFEWQSAIVPNPLIFSPQTLVTEVLDCLNDRSSDPDIASTHSSCLVVDQEQVVGIFSPQAVIQVLGQYWRQPEQLESLTVEAIMTSPMTIAAAAVNFELLQGIFQESAPPGVIVVSGANNFSLITARSLLINLPSTQGGTSLEQDCELERDCEQTQLFQSTFEQAAVGIAHASPTGQFIRVNQKFCEITGYDYEEIMQLSFQDITYPDDLSIDLEYVYQLSAGTLNTYTLEKRYVCKNHSITWVSLTASLVRHADGSPSYFIGVIVDINDRKKLERDRQRALSTLAHSQALYENLIINFSEAIFLTDDAGDLVFIGSSAHQIFGVSSLDLWERKNIAHILGDDFVTAIELVKARGEIVNQECNVVHSSGKLRHLLVNIKQVNFKLGTVLYSCRDATERKEAEEELQLYEHIISTTQDLMSFVDRDYRYRVVNDTYARRFGRSKAEIIGRTPVDVMGEETFQEVVKPHLDRCFEGEQVHYQAWFNFADQKQHYLDVLYAPYRESEGEVTGAVVSVRDLTSVYESERLLSLQARRAEALLALPSASETLSEQAFLQYGQELVEDLTESQIAFIHFVNNDEQTIELVAWSHRTLQHFCTATFDTHYPVSQAGIWADALREHQPVVFNDYDSYPHKKGLPQGHAVLHRLISVPVIENGKVVMLTGVGNKATDYTDVDLETVQLLSNEIWRIAQAKRTLSQLRNLNRELEQRVEERAARLYLATQAARIGIWDWDVVNDRLTWDDRMYEIYGRNGRLEETQTFNTWESSLHPEDAEQTKRALQQALKGQSDFQVTFRIVQPAGKVCWIEAYGLVKRDDQGHPLRVIGVNADITDRKTAEEQIQQESVFRQQILDNMAEGLCVCKILPDFPSIRFSLWNPGMEDITGYTLAEINVQNWPKILYANPEIRYRVIALMNTLRRGQNVISQEWQIQHKNGQQRTVAVSISILPTEDSHPMLLGLLQDISARKQAEIRLQQTQFKFQRLVDDIGDDFMVFSYSVEKQAITYVSSGIRSIFGLFRQDVIDKDWHDVIQWSPSSIAQQKEAIQQFQKSRISFQQLEMEFTHPNGESRIVQISQHPLFNEFHELVAVEGVMGDITQRKKAEASLQQTNEELARATRLKDEFLAAMSHELRTPLNAVLGMSEVLLEEVLGSINEKQRQSLDTIQRSGRHLLDLINDILDLSKIEAGKLELNRSPVSIEALCSSSIVFVKQQALRKQIHLKTTLPPQLSPVLLDERRMRQVLVNLLSNAVKFTPKDGSVHLEVSVRPSETNSPSYRIRFAVTDTGIGISEADQAKLFQPFVQIDGSLNRQYSGTGLGLSLVKRIVDLHRGSVGVQSVLGEGSCFWVDLPCQFDAAHPVPIAPSLESTTLETVEPTRPPLILLAEDNEANVSTLQNYLGAKGYELVIASNGQEALDLTRSLRPDLILMDIQMPVMDGLTAIAKLREDSQYKETPIIALTALAMPGDEDRCLSAGANAYLTKPVKLKQLITTMKGLLQPSES